MVLRGGGRTENLFLELLMQFCFWGKNALWGLTSLTVSILLYTRKSQKNWGWGWMFSQHQILYLLNLEQDGETNKFVLLFSLDGFAGSHTSEAHMISFSVEICFSCWWKLTRPSFCLSRISERMFHECLEITVNQLCQNTILLTLDTLLSAHTRIPT